MIDISVIIPVYNSSLTIVASIDSVVRECAGNSYAWELIVVDDGSPDNSAQIIEQYISQSPHKENIRLIRQPNGGASVARNTGIEAARGEFIAFNDSDDRWLEGKLRLQMEFMKSNDDVVMVAGIFGDDNLSTFKKYMGPKTLISIRDQVLKNYFSPPTTLIRVSILEKSGLFNPKMRYAEEGYFFNNIVYHGKSILLNQKVAEPITSKERWGDSGLSGNLIKMEKGELFNIKSSYRIGYISLGRFIFASCFSLAKFVRRWLIVNFRKLCK